MRNYANLYLIFFRRAICFLFVCLFVCFFVSRPTSVFMVGCFYFFRSFPFISVQYTYMYLCGSLGWNTLKSQARLSLGWLSSEFWNYVFNLVFPDCFDFAFLLSLISCTADFTAVRRTGFFFQSKMICPLWFTHNHNLIVRSRLLYDLYPTMHSNVSRRVSLFALFLKPVKEICRSSGSFW